jgi:hypothetical protein
MHPVAQRIARLLAPLVLLGSTVFLAAPATHAALNATLEITAEHQSIVVDGLFFSNYTNDSITLDAYAINGGQKVFIASAQRTPTIQTGNTFVWNLAEAEDPCTTSAAPQVEVDAYLTHPVLVRAAAVRTIIGRLPFPPVLTGPEVATNTVTVECGVIIF